jgi:hypothetical protein
MADEREQRWRESIDIDTDRLLVNFEPIAFAGKVSALVAADAPNELKDRVLAAITSYEIGNKGIDHVYKTYFASKRRPRREPIGEIQAETHRAALDRIERTFAQLDSERAEPTLGEFGAALVLERLRTSFFSAHVLYRLGRLIEAHAVSRFILEQIAWAYGARHCDDEKSLKAVSATKSVTLLKTLIPGMGKLYGSLTRYAHLGFSEHDDFVWTRKSGRAALVISNQREAVVEELVLLGLADACAIVYEISQHRFMKKSTSVRRAGDAWIPRPNRPFIRVMRSFAKKAFRARESAVP